MHDGDSRDARFPRNINDMTQDNLRISRVETGRRLIEQKQSGRLNKSPRETSELPLPVAKRRHRQMGERRKTDRGKRLGDGYFVRGGITHRQQTSMRSTPKHDILKDGKRRCRALSAHQRNLSRHRPARHTANILTAEIDTPRTPGQKSGQPAQKGRLACTIGADD